MEYGCTVSSGRRLEPCPQCSAVGRQWKLWLGLLLGDLLVIGDVLRMVVVPGLALTPPLSQFLSCEVSKFVLTLTYTK